MTDLTDARLSEIELRLLSAQPGPWAVSSEDDSCVYIDVPGGVGALAWFDSRDEDDAEFCAHARTDVPDLIAALRSERTQNEALENENGRLVGTVAVLAEDANKLAAELERERTQNRELLAGVRSAVWVLDGNRLSPEEESEIRALAEETHP